MESLVMFQFSDKDIDSALCGSYDCIDDDGETEQGFILMVNDKEVLLTDSEIHYMMEEVKKLK